jgi:hypothetical protein
LFSHENSRTLRRLWIGGCAAAVLCVGGCQVQSSSGPQNPGQVPPTSGEISFCDPGASGCPSGNSFSLDSLSELTIQVSLHGVPAGNHAEKVDVFLPGGGLYQSTQTGFLIAPDSDGSFSATQSIPVAGTWIAQRHEVGDWSVTISLDGQAVTTQKVSLNR